MWSCRTILPWNLLSADDQVLIADRKEQVLETYENWKDGMADRSLRVNVGKTKMMIGDVNEVCIRESGVVSDLVQYVEGY